MHASSDFDSGSNYRSEIEVQNEDLWIVNNFNFQVLTRIVLSTQCFALCNQNVTTLVLHFNLSGSPK
jgi:hypothetical protein